MKKHHKALTHRKQGLTIMGPLASKRHEAFCLEYMKDRNGSAAYKRAGYKPKNDDVAKANASRLLTNANVGVSQRIAELEANYATKIGFEIEDALNTYLSIVNADPAELTALVRGACRYCHGINHDYHWRTAREYAEGIRRHLCAPDAAKVYALKPSDDGGCGYRTTMSPHPDCPECDGLGIARAHFAGTDSIPKASRPLLAGIEETQHGIKIKMHDQMAALYALAKHIGFFSKYNSRTIETSDALTELLISISQKSSKMAVNSPSRSIIETAIET